MEAAMSKTITKRLGFTRYAKAEWIITVPGSLTNSGEPYQLVSEMVVEEIAEDWVSARMVGTDIQYVFGNHPEAVDSNLAALKLVQ